MPKNEYTITLLMYCIMAAISAVSTEEEEGQIKGWTPFLLIALT